MSSSRPRPASKASRRQPAKRSQPSKPRGRPRRPITPRTAAPATPAAPVSATEAYRLEVQHAQARSAAGQRLAHHEVRALRDAWLLDQAAHLWAGVDACAAELGVSASTVRGFAGEGCPHLEAHSPIPKAPVLAWLLKRAHERGAAPSATHDSLEEVQLRIQSAKAAKLEGALVAEAEGHALAGLQTRITRLRQALLTSLPSQAYELAADPKTPRDQAEAGIQAAIESALLAAADDQAEDEDAADDQADDTDEPTTGEIAPTTGEIAPAPSTP
jgi:hypothetical protein